MKNSYSDSLLAFTAAYTQACILYKHSDEIADVPVKARASAIHQLCINNATIGIKFDTISVRKYFVLIYKAQQLVFVNKTRETYDHLKLPIPAESGVRANSETCYRLKD